MSRAITKEEAREILIRHFIGLAKHWCNETRLSVPERFEGLIFSILSTFDGSSVNLPAFDIVPMPHAEDMEYCKTEGIDYFVRGKAINDDVQLHELFDGILKSEDTRKVRLMSDVLLEDAKRNGWVKS